MDNQPQVAAAIALTNKAMELQAKANELEAELHRPNGMLDGKLEAFRAAESAAKAAWTAREASLRERKLID